jgi:hypothetical protein
MLALHENKYLPICQRPKIREIAKSVFRTVTATQPTSGKVLLFDLGTPLKIP